MPCMRGVNMIRFRMRSTPIGKATLEWLFWTGQVAVAERRNFERRYDIPERVLPPEVIATPTPTIAPIASGCIV